MKVFLGGVGLKRLRKQKFRKPTVIHYQPSGTHDTSIPFDHRTPICRTPTFTLTLRLLGPTRISLHSG